MFKFNLLGLDWDFTFIKVTLIVLLIISYAAVVPLVLLLAALSALFFNYYITIICVFLGCLYYASWDSLDSKITKLWDER